MLIDLIPEDGWDLERNTSGDRKRSSPGFFNNDGHPTARELLIVLADYTKLNWNVAGFACTKFRPKYKPQSDGKPFYENVVVDSN